MKNFYLKYYKIIHHTLTIFLMFISNYYIFGITETLTSLPLQFLLLLLSYWICEFSLNKSGLSDEIEKEKNKKEE
jgi:hypothetical protein